MPNQEQTSLSLLIPCFNEDKSIEAFYNEATQAISEIKDPLDYRLIFIDDGSTDNTLKILQELSKNDDHVNYICFSRNFGKEAAMLAGLQASNSEFTAMLDADLQHPPSLIPQMFNAMQNENTDCVAMVRTRKGDSHLRSFFTRFFYKIINKLTDIEIIDGVGDFRMMNRKYVNALLQLQERNRFLKAMYPWIGFNTKQLEYENVQRTLGETKWSFKQLFIYSWNGIIGSSSKLLSIASIFGTITCFFALLIIVFAIVRKLFWGVSVDGWTTLVSLIAFFSGIQLFTIGILGQYLAKTYNEVKQRPHYLIKETHLR